MKPVTIFVVVPCLLPVVAAQSDDPLSIFVSEAYSVYTEVTQILSSVASAASQGTTDSSSTVEASTTSESPTTTATNTPSTSSATSVVSSSTSSSASTSTLHSSSATSSHISSITATSLSPSALGTSSVVGVTAETSTPLSRGSGTNHDHKLAIILGTVLGALAVGLFILAVLLCRRRRRGELPRHRALSPGDDEVESWRLNRQSDIPESKNSSHHALGASGSAPLMSEHPAFRNYDDLENPFVPVPPAPRRTAPNSRAGLTDGMVPGDEPFLNEKEVAVARPTSWPKGFTSSATPITFKKDAGAAGVAGAAVGAGLMHHDHNKKNHKRVENSPRGEKTAEPQVPRQIHRKPVPVNYVNNSEAWPYSPVSPVDPAAEAAALPKFPARNSGESQRSFGRDAARANATFDQEYAPAGSGHGHHRSLDAAELAAGAAAGVALAHQHDRHQSGRRSSEHTQPRSQSPKDQSSTRQGKDSNQSASSAPSNNRNSYSDDLPTNPYHDVLAAEPPLADEPEQPLIRGQHDSQPQQAFSALPPAPPARSPRRDSGPGTVAPMFNNPNRPAVPSPLSSEIRPESLRKARGVNALPSRRSRTRSGGSPSNSRNRYSFEYDDTPFDTYPPGAGADHYGSFAAQNSTPDKSVVGDNGYPHMNVPRRESGQYEVDYDPPKAARRDSTPTPPPLPRVNNTSSLMSLDGADFAPAFDHPQDFDSNWRMSSGMPSGWQRQKQGQRRSSSPRNSGNYMRDSGIGGIGGSGGPKEARRLRASDLAGGDRYPQMGLGQAL